MKPMEGDSMTTCNLCSELAKKSRSTKPHEHLAKLDEPRIFQGGRARGYEEQDYQCLECRARLTHSTNRNDYGWTLWQA